MKLKYLLTTICIILAGISNVFAQSNVLSIPDVLVAQGKSIALSVNLDNTADVAALQFTLTTPEGITLDASSAALTERSDGHSVNFQKTGVNTYMAMVFSSMNNSVKGRTGKLLSVTLSASSSLEEGSILPLSLSDVVISARDGSNLTTGFSAGKVTIAKSPDLEVSNVTIDKTTIAPNEKITVGWQVANIGGLATTAGWNEQILLESVNGATKLLGTIYHDEPLNPNGVVSRNAEMNIPALIGIDGDAKIRVKLTANSNAGEPIGLQDNNTAVTNQTIIVKKLLTITPEYANIDESQTKTVRFQLTRSGSTTHDEVFKLARTADPRLSLPETITISKGQSGVYFYAQVTANGVQDNDSIVNFTISGNDYPEIASKVVINDDTYPSLSITTDAQDVTEGGSIKFTISTERISTQDIEVRLSCDFTSRFEIPSNIIIPAGQQSVDVIVNAKEDDIPDVEQVVTFVASAAGHNNASIYTVLIDDDVPTLKLEITPNAISEGAGPLAVTAKLSRTDNIDKLVTVKLFDDSNGNIYYGRQTIEMAVGVKEVTVNLGPIDNAIVDGERTYNISAAVFIASCSCNANNGTSGGVVSVPLTVYDNDGPTLTMATSASILKEGGEIDVTIKRNTNTSEALTVNISSDHESSLEYPSTVIIPAGKTEATFTVKSKGNDTTGDGFTAMLTATADGFATGNTWFTVSDQTLPDAQITDISVSAEEVEVGGKIMVDVTIANTGSYELPELTKIGIYTNNSSTAVTTLYLQAPLGAGESVLMSREITMPSAIGTYRVYAVANDGNGVKELVYTNNTSQMKTVKTVSPFSVSVSTDKQVYKQGESVVLSGTVTGTDVENKEVEIYVINDNYRHVITATTDEQGHFSADYKPYSGQMGHFIAGACYPKEGLTTEMASFDVYGVKRTSNAYITCEALLGEPYKGSFEVSNPGNLSLSNIKVDVASKPDNCDVTIVCPNTVDAGAVFNVEYTIDANAVSEGNDWQQISLNLTSDEGATLQTTLYYYCRSAKGQLKASVSRINTTMIKDSSRDYPFIITNVGKGETGKITLDLPSWMSAVTPKEMASLAYGDSATVILRFTPIADMQLNVPVTGFFSLNCENGKGITLNYSIEPVSEDSGTLCVDVCDEYTYYTAEAPHVANAKVYVKHPYTGSVIAEGTTKEDGTYSIELPEGYYKLEVTAEKHESYSNFCYVDPGRTESIKINLSYQPITISWNVEETEVEDEYRIETTVQYETNVPMPVVKITIPKSIDGDNMAVGDVTMIYMTLTNIGLIRADNVTLLLPNDMTEWEFTPLDYNEPFSLNPNQSVAVPILITRIANEGIVKARKKGSFAEDMGDSYRNCMAGMGTRYEYDCGEDIKKNAAAERLAMKACAYVATAQAIGEILNRIFGGGSSGLSSPGGGSGGGGNSVDYNEVKKTLDICDECDAQRVEKIVQKGLNYLWIGPLDAGIDAAIEACQKQSSGSKIIIRKVKENVINAIKDAIVDFFTNGASKIVNIIFDVVDVVETCNEKTARNMADNAQKSVSKHDWVDIFDQKALDYVEQLKAIDTILFYSYGDRLWYEDLDQEKLDFLDYVNTLPEGYIPTDEELIQHKPESVSLNQLKAYIDYINGDGQNELPKEEDILAQFDIFKNYDELAKNEGYKSMTDRFGEAYETYCKHYEEMSSSSVCASITLRFSQTMTMTRQAFRGTLTVFNGHEETAMSDVKLSLTVKDESGNLATSHEFQINAETLAGFEGELNLTDGWTLGAQETGTATILFIPTKYAAPTVEKVYYFGGSLSYIDPFTGLEVTRTLTPIALTVKPSPNLDLTYFMQRDIIGDDPLTEVVEPCEEAEFSLLINNIGYGDATNVQMVTDQPKIIENEKGLYIDFELISSQLNGGDKTLALGGSVATDFGTIPAMSTAYAQWWIKSSLLGHFTDYNVEATHVTSYGNPDLSLLNEVTIHELIRSLDIVDGDNKMVGFLTNDIVDAEDAPDMIYLSNGEVESVATVQNAVLQKISDTGYLLTVSPKQEGWNYGNVSDLTYGAAKLKSVVRQSDGKEMPLRNFWQTDRTLRDGKDPLYENRIHFADNMVTSQEETYILTFEPQPKVMLEVAEYTGVPEENTVLKEQLTELTVRFNKPIKAESFTTEDISINCQGVAQDASQITITKVNEQEYKLGLNEVTLADGYYVLTVQTTNIIDTEGFTGLTGKQASWIQFVDGKVALKLTASPAEGGTISPSSGRFDYDSDVTVKATPNEGYDFVAWMADNVNVSTEREYTYHLTDNTELKAMFSIRHYNVIIDYDTTQGIVEGASSGIYEYGTQLQLTAIPADEYTFDAWQINDERVFETEHYTITVNGDMKINALFKELISTDIETIDSDALRIKITPIPIHDMMYISGNFNTLRMVNIYDMRGVKCLTAQNVQPDQSIYVGKLSAGIYYIQIVTDRGVYSTKVLKR